MTEYRTAIYLVAVPVELNEAWLQHMRDFAVQHPGCPCKMMVCVRESAAEIAETMERVDNSMKEFKKH